MESHFPRIGLIQTVYGHNLKMTWVTLVKTLDWSSSCAAANLLKEYTVYFLFLTRMTMNVSKRRRH
jgi:hypothetical protein